MKPEERRAILIGFTGLVVLIIGCSMISAALAWIVAGLWLMVCAVGHFAAIHRAKEDAEVENKVKEMKDTLKPVRDNVVARRNQR
tara:strand:+ start:976 stop:1230 length:255 start_codon:yes stop_codon:yes gene_type:complete